MKDWCERLGDEATKAIKSGSSVTCGGRFSPYRRDFSRQGDQETDLWRYPYNP